MMNHTLSIESQIWFTAVNIAARVLEGKRCVVQCPTPEIKNRVMDRVVQILVEVQKNKPKRQIFTTN